MNDLSTTLPFVFYQPNDTLWLLGASFIGGVISTLLPCSIAMAPILVGTIGSLGDTNHKARLFLQITLFVVGLATTLAILGLMAGLLGETLSSLGGPNGAPLIKAAVGLISIGVGCQLLTWFHIPLPQWLSRLPDPNHLKWLGLGAPFALGVLFGMASTPCGTPFLAAILGLISQTKNVVLGGACLFLYGLGQGLLLFMVGLLTGVMKYWAQVRQVGQVFNQLSGGVFLLIGIGMIADALGYLDGLAQAVLQY
ncbi:MAG: cytochrome c biogenesis protein CcdA [Vampirovibrionales bacterium]